jgi:hypothetical protein
MSGKRPSEPSDHGTFKKNRLQLKPCPRSKARKSIPDPPASDPPVLGPRIGPTITHGTLNLLVKDYPTVINGRDALAIAIAKVASYSKHYPADLSLLEDHFLDKLLVSLHETGLPVLDEYLVPCPFRGRIVVINKNNKLPVTIRIIH